MKPPRPSSTRSHRARARERGVVLLFCLVILVVMLAGGVAVVRSMNTSLAGAGNLAFKRDLVNQGDQAAADALTLFRNGALAGSGTGGNSIQASNYSAVRLDTNPAGIPLALLSDTAYAAVAATTVTRADAGVTVRYVIDRLCNTAGLPSPADCIYAPATTDVRGGDITGAGRPPPPKALVYRLSVRVDGPRQTQVFLQSSFTKPE